MSRHLSLGQTTKEASARQSAEYRASCTHSRKGGTVKALAADPSDPPAFSGAANAAKRYVRANALRTFTLR